MTEDAVQEEEKKEEEVKPKFSVLEETKKAIADLRKEREEITKVRDELQQLRSDQLLAGTAGGHIEPEKPKEESPTDYVKRVMTGDLNESE